MTEGPRPPTPVGVIPNIEFKVDSIHLEPGDVLVGYTDGVTYARNPIDESMSEVKLLALLAKPATSARKLLLRVKNRVRAHISAAEQFDDITLVVLRRITDSVTSDQSGVQVGTIPPNRGHPEDVSDEVSDFRVRGSV